MPAKPHPEAECVWEEYVRPGFAIPGPVWPGWPKTPWLLYNPPQPIERFPEPPWLPIDML